MNHGRTLDELSSMKNGQNFEGQQCVSELHNFMDEMRL
jgi:hypothetical protein